ncbi:MAG: PucR family transcriptional regulator ligand-binding domain-containing protein [Candidatus Metalachnospira sp.]|nr:PucR family transcriptional regulator ligand-binding domain-containing protein [Candidatus Metalachnospira sp.]
MRLKSLLEKLYNYDLSLLAGERGLDNNITWNHVGEEPRVAEYIQGGEIVSLTGFQLGNNETKILQYVEDIEKHGATGVIFALGGYIKEVPKSVIDFGSLHNFPVFSTPWQTWLVELNRKIGEAIIEDERMKTTLEENFKIMLFSPESYKFYNSIFEEYGFGRNDYYLVLVTEKFESFDDIDNIIRKVAKKDDCGSICLKIETQIVAIISGKTIMSLNHFSGCIKPYSENFCMGISQIISGITEISKAFEQAEDVLLLRRNSPEINVTRYDDLGVYQMLFCIKDKKAISKYCKDALGTIEQYDKDNGTDLMKTLKVYFDEDGSSAITGEILQKHRNTINYQINKVKELIGIDNFTLEEKFKIILAMKLKEVLNAKINN